MYLRYLFLIKQDNQKFRTGFILVLLLMDL